jgi:hypothetical protein
MGPRERAYAAFLSSPGATLDRDVVQLRRAQTVRKQPLPPSTAPGPDARQRRRHAIKDRAQRRFSTSTGQLRARSDQPSFEERVAEALLHLGFLIDAVIDDVVDLEDLVERQSRS